MTTDFSRQELLIFTISKLLVDTATGATYARRAWREDPRSTTFTLRIDF